MSNFSCINLFECCLYCPFEKYRLHVLSRTENSQFLCLTHISNSYIHVRLYLSQIKLWNIYYHRYCVCFIFSYLSWIHKQYGIYNEIPHHVCWIQYTEHPQAHLYLLISRGYFFYCEKNMTSGAHVNTNVKCP